jgi:CRP-like cAMP-binding protein
MQFLEQVIPQMYWMTTKAKKRIANAFREKHYLPDQVIMKEGDKALNMMVIWEGECMFYSSKNPLKY